MESRTREIKYVQPQACPANLISFVSYPQVAGYPHPPNGNQYPPPPYPYSPQHAYPLHQGYLQPYQGYRPQGCPPQFYQQPYEGYPPQFYQQPYGSYPQLQQPPRKNKMGFGRVIRLLRDFSFCWNIGNEIVYAGYGPGYDDGVYGPVPGALALLAKPLGTVVLWKSPLYIELLPCDLKPVITPSEGPPPVLCPIQIVRAILISTVANWPAILREYLPRYFNAAWKPFETRLCKGRIALID
eukprot:Gb_01546 [translate_table: standard]